MVQSESCCPLQESCLNVAGNPLLQSIKLMSTFPIVINVALCSQLSQLQQTTTSNTLRWNTQHWLLWRRALTTWAWGCKGMWPMKQSKITIFEYEATAAFLCLVWSIGNMTAALEFEIFYKITVKIDEMFPFQFWWQSQIKHKIKDTAHKIITRILSNWCT